MSRESPKRMKSEVAACEMPGFYFDILVDELPDSSVIPCCSHVAWLRWNLYNLYSICPFWRGWCRLCFAGCGFFVSCFRLAHLQWQHSYGISAAPGWLWGHWCSPKTSGAIGVLKCRHLTVMASCGQAIMAMLANYIGVDAFLNGLMPVACTIPALQSQPCFYILGDLPIWEVNLQMCWVPASSASETKVRYRMQRTARTWLVLALCLWVALPKGSIDWDWAQMFGLMWAFVNPQLAFVPIIFLRIFSTSHLNWLNSRLPRFGFTKLSRILFTWEVKSPHSFAARVKGGYGT